MWLSLLAMPLCDRDVKVFFVLGVFLSLSFKTFIPIFTDGSLVSLPNCISCELHS